MFKGHAVGCTQHTLLCLQWKCFVLKKQSLWKPNGCITGGHCGRGNVAAWRSSHDLQPWSCVLYYAGRRADFRSSVKLIAAIVLRLLLHHLSWSGGFPLQGNKQALPVCSAQHGTMDFNVKKLASDAGVFFTRAVQVNHLLGIRDSSNIWTDLPPQCGVATFCMDGKQPSGHDARVSYSYNTDKTLWFSTYHYKDKSRCVVAFLWARPAL